MPDSASRWRSYLGLALVIVAYVGGMIGWSCAALTVESESAAPDTARVVMGAEEGMPGPEERQARPPLPGR